MRQAGSGNERLISNDMEKKDGSVRSFGLQRMKKNPVIVFLVLCGSGLIFIGDLVEKGERLWARFSRDRVSMDATLEQLQSKIDSSAQFISREAIENVLGPAVFTQTTVGGRLFATYRLSDACTLRHVYESGHSIAYSLCAERPGIAFDLGRSVGDPHVQLCSDTFLSLPEPPLAYYEHSQVQFRTGSTSSYGIADGYALGKHGEKFVYYSELTRGSRANRFETSILGSHDWRVGMLDPVRLKVSSGDSLQEQVARAHALEGVLTIDFAGRIRGGDFPPSEDLVQFLTLPPNIESRAEGDSY